MKKFMVIFVSIIFFVSNVVGAEQQQMIKQRLSSSTSEGGLIFSPKPSKKYCRVSDSQSIGQETTSTSLSASLIMAALSSAKRMEILSYKEAYEQTKIPFPRTQESLASGEASPREKTPLETARLNSIDKEMSNNALYPSSEEQDNLKISSEENGNDDCFFELELDEKKTEKPKIYKTNL